MRRWLVVTLVVVLLLEVAWSSAFDQSTGEGATGSGGGFLVVAKGDL